jgi:hypothetical protein
MVLKFKFASKGEVFVLSILIESGLILHVAKISNTHITSSGGGGYLHNGSGHVAAATVRSTVEVITTIYFKRLDGSEVTHKYNGDISAREGQTLHRISINNSYYQLINSSLGEAYSIGRTNLVAENAISIIKRSSVISKITELIEGNNATLENINSIMRNAQDILDNLLTGVETQAAEQRDKSIRLNKKLKKIFIGMVIFGFILVTFYSIIDYFNKIQADRQIAKNVILYKEEALKAEKISKLFKEKQRLQNVDFEEKKNSRELVLQAEESERKKEKFKLIFGGWIGKIKCKQDNLITTVNVEIAINAEGAGVWTSQRDGKSIKKMTFQSEMHNEINEFKFNPIKWLVNESSEISNALPNTNWRQEGGSLILLEDPYSCVGRLSRK